MRVLVIMSLVIATTCGQLQTNNNVGPHARIIGGTIAPEGAFPYQVSVRGSNGNHTCGGSIISPTVIVTAAHCVWGLAPSHLSVVAGSNYLNHGGTKYGVSFTRVHPRYSSITLKNDIAILKLSTPIRFSSMIMPIELTTTNIGANVDAVLSGWGTTTYPGSTPNRLQYMFSKTITVTECRRHFIFPNVDNSQVCTFTQPGQGACHGDRGSPLVSNGYLVGIVSWGRPCAVGLPDVYTRVSYFFDWINKNSN